MYELIIIGAGPAGLAASIYASRYKINHIVIGSVLNGSLPKAHMIENWPGEESIKGADLIMKFLNHAKSLQAEIAQEEVLEIKKENDKFIVKTNANKSYEAKTVLIAVGTSHRKLNISGEEEFLGRGVSYCAVCDGPFFKNKIVAVAGGSNSAAMAALMLAEHADKVYVVYRGERLRCEPIMLERMERNQKIEIIYNTNITKAFGKNKLASVEVDKEYNGAKIIELDGLFVEIGSIPSISLIKGLGIAVDKNDFIVVDETCATNIRGVYAAGDVTIGSNGLRQIVTAVAEGAIAATSIYKFLKGN